MRLLIVMLFLQLTWAASGWTIEDAQEKSLARYFTNVSLAIQHWEIYPGATLVDEWQKEKAIRQLMVFINAERERVNVANHNLVHFGKQKDNGCNRWKCDIQWNSRQSMIGP